MISDFGPPREPNVSRRTRVTHGRTLSPERLDACLRGRLTKVRKQHRAGVNPRSVDAACAERRARPTRVLNGTSLRLDRTPLICLQDLQHALLGAQGRSTACPKPTQNLPRMRAKFISPQTQ